MRSGPTPPPPGLPSPRICNCVGRPDAECGRGDNSQTDDLDFTHCDCPFVPCESPLTSHGTPPPPVIAVTRWRRSGRTASTGEREAGAGSQAGRSGTPLSWPWLQITNVWRKRTSLRGRASTTKRHDNDLRKYHSVARCTLLGEIDEDTAHRYYYRPHVGGELTFVDENHRRSTSRHARRARTGPPANNAAAPPGRTRDDIDPRRRRPGSGSANRLVARRLVGRPDLIERGGSTEGGGWACQASNVHREVVGDYSEEVG